MFVFFDLKAEVYLELTWTSTMKHFCENSFNSF